MTVTKSQMVSRFLNPMDILIFTLLQLSTAFNMLMILLISWVLVCHTLLVFLLLFFPNLFCQVIHLYSTFNCWSSSKISPRPTVLLMLYPLQLVTCILMLSVIIYIPTSPKFLLVAQTSWSTRPFVDLPS